MFWSFAVVVIISIILSLMSGICIVDVGIVLGIGAAITVVIFAYILCLFIK